MFLTERRPAHGYLGAERLACGECGLRSQAKALVALVGEEGLRTSYPVRLVSGSVLIADMTPKPAPENVVEKEENHWPRTVLAELKRRIYVGQGELGHAH